jgi:hypothetical protein
VDGQPVVEGKTRVAAAQIGGCRVALQFRGERRERVGEAPQIREYLFGREQVLHHHEAHKVQPEVTRDRGRFYGCAQPVRVVRSPRLGGLVDAAVPR